MPCITSVPLARGLFVAVSLALLPVRSVCADTPLSGCNNQLSAKRQVLVFLRRSGAPDADARELLKNPLIRTAEDAPFRLVDGPRDSAVSGAETLNSPTSLFRELAERYDRDVVVGVELMARPGGDGAEGTAARIYVFDAALSSFIPDGEHPFWLRKIVPGRRIDIGDSGDLAEWITRILCQQAPWPCKLSLPLMQRSGDFYVDERLVPRLFAARGDSAQNVTAVECPNGINGDTHSHRVDFFPDDNLNYNETTWSLKHSCAVPRPVRSDPSASPLPLPLSMSPSPEMPGNLEKSQASSRSWLNIVGRPSFLGTTAIAAGVLIGFGGSALAVNGECVDPQSSGLCTSRMFDTKDIGNGLLWSGITIGGMAIASTITYIIRCTRYGKLQPGKGCHSKKSNK